MILLPSSIRYRIFSFLPCFHLSTQRLRQEWGLLHIVRLLKKHCTLSPTDIQAFQQAFIKTPHRPGRVSFDFRNDEMWLNLEYTSAPARSYFMLHSYLVMFL
jgi:hypothetical protein